MTSLVFAWARPAQLFIWIGCKQVISGSHGRFLTGSPGSQRLSVCGSARLIGLGGWFPSPAWQLSGCVPQFSSFPPSQSAHSPGWSSPAVGRTGRLWANYPGCQISWFHCRANHILGGNVPFHWQLHAVWKQQPWSLSQLNLFRYCDGLGEFSNPRLLAVSRYPSIPWQILPLD